MTTLVPVRLDTLDLRTAGENLVTAVPVAAPDQSAGMMRAALTGQHFDSAADIAVCDGSRLVGLIRIEDLLAAPDAVLARDLMDAEPPVVRPGVSREMAAWQAVNHGEGSLAVVDDDDGFVGLIPPPRLLAILLLEHDEDMSRLGGFVHDAQAARSASEEAIIRRFRHRMPWLLVGLIGALLATILVSSFEGSLEDNVILAFFIPGVIYMADAVGTQTETIVIRGLSVQVPIRRVFRCEAITGVLVGIAVALVFYPVALIGWGDADVALAVALSLLGACSVAAVIAMVLPFGLFRLGLDPAFGSGPLATVVQDLLSILIYFGVADAIAGA
jgi:magnesium transporter